MGECRALHLKLDRLGLAQRLLAKEVPKHSSHSTKRPRSCVLWREQFSIFSQSWMWATRKCPPAPLFQVDAALEDPMTARGAPRR